MKARGLTCEQRAFNRWLSVERVVVEHMFSRLKKFRIVAYMFRNHLKSYDVMMDVVCGLVNLRIAGTTAL